MKYPNLKAEIARKQYTCAQLGEAIGVSEDMMSFRLRGKTRFTLAERKTLRAEFFPECTLEYLFSEEAIV